MSFLDGKNSDGKIVSNPNIGYGRRDLKYADGSTREFYRIGLSANMTGISVYVVGLEDKTYLSQTYGGKLGKASVTGYCIKFKTLKDIDLDVLEEAIRFGARWPRAYRNLNSEAANLEDLFLPRWRKAGMVVWPPRRAKS